MICHSSFVASNQPTKPWAKTSRQAGEVEYCDMLYTDWGEPRGVGFVRYKTEQVKGIITGSIFSFERLQFSPIKNSCSVKFGKKKRPV